MHSDWQLHTNPLMEPGRLPCKRASSPSLWHVGKDLSQSPFQVKLWLSGNPWTSPTSFSDPGSGGGGATGRPMICNNSSLKIIHSIGRNRLPHFKIHLKHWGFEEAVVFLKNIFISKGGLCMSEFQSLLSWTRFHRRSTKSYFIVNGNAGWRKENKTQLPSDCPIKVHV